MEGSIKAILDFFWDVLTNFWAYCGFILLVLIIRGDVGKSFGKMHEFFAKVGVKLKEKKDATKVTKFISAQRKQP